MDAANYNFPSGGTPSGPPHGIFPSNSRGGGGGNNYRFQDSSSSSKLQGGGGLGGQQNQLHYQLRPHARQDLSDLETIRREENDMYGMMPEGGGGAYGEGPIAHGSSRFNQR